MIGSNTNAFIERKLNANPQKTEIFTNTIQIYGYFWINKTIDANIIEVDLSTDFIK